MLKFRRDIAAAVLNKSSFEQQVVYYISGYSEIRYFFFKSAQLNPI